MKRSEIAAAMNALRERTWHYCLVCNKRFSGIKKAKFCSNACRQKNKYAKAKAGKLIPPAV